MNVVAISAGIVSFRNGIFDLHVRRSISFGFLKTFFARLPWKVPNVVVFAKTLKDLLTSSRIYEKRCREQSCRYCTSEKICELQGTVYLIQCGGCGEKYVGETARPLKIRLDEHRRALANPAAYPHSSFSRHRTLRH
ncbi:hypothetical protein V3C99_004926, partial [Haemonchus contortus]